MAGRRLLDAARLVNVGASVAKQHYRLRRQQWDVYSQTSSLVKAVKSQTDRVTVTVGAAIELAKRFNETNPPWQHTQSDFDRRTTREEDNWARESGSFTTAAEQDVSRGHKSSADSYEQPLPATTATGPTSSGTSGGHDTFNERPKTVTSSPSPLPHANIPEHVEAAASSPSSNLNQDVFPVPLEKITSTEESEIEGNLGGNAFSTPRVSRMMGSGSLGSVGPYATRQKLPPTPLKEMVEASERWKKEREIGQESEAASVHPKYKLTRATQEDTQDLVSAIATEVQQAPAASEAAEGRPYEMRESRVPSSRFGRIWQYGGLATSMAFGAVGEGIRRMAGGTGQGSLMLSENNMNRLVAKLSRMRGAALKMGQMISFQDSKVLPETINIVLQRVQDSADYMPASQRNQVLIRNLGHDWKDLFSDFEEKPFAAASIGQVHRATLKSNNQAVAVKIQYPGVRNSIDSDLNNLSLLLTASQLLPRGLFLDKTIANARTELGWECDYEREAKACIKFKTELLNDEPDVFSVPTVYTEASGPDVLTAEFMHGKGVTKIKDLTQEERNWIGSNILRLCLRELMEWRFMQTDPNWTNFLYNRQERKLELLDFGASREYPDKFVEPYVSLLIAASKGDRDACRDLSIQLGYLTGQESKEMLKAHVDSILTLAEPFTQTAPEVYDFEDQTITDRVRSNIGLMLRERMAPPPEETYSLHRKLSGAFLLCARLKSKVEAREMFANAAKLWERRPKSL